MSTITAEVVDTGVKRVLIRAIGPTLAAPRFNIGGIMSDPRLALYSGQQVIASNNNWPVQSSALTAAQLSTSADSVGAFRLRDSTSKDSVLFVTLNPGNYTAQVTGTMGGLALTKVYEVP